MKKTSSGLTSQNENCVCRTRNSCDLSQVIEWYWQIRQIRDAHKWPATISITTVRHKCQSDPYQCRFPRGFSIGRELSIAISTFASRRVISLLALPSRGGLRPATLLPAHPPSLTVIDLFSSLSLRLATRQAGRRMLAQIAICTRIRTAADSWSLRQLTVKLSKSASENSVSITKQLEE